MKSTRIWGILTQKNKTIDGIIAQTAKTNVNKLKRAYERKISDLENEIEDKESSKTHFDLALSASFLDKEFGKVADNFIQNQTNLDIEIYNLNTKLKFVKAQYEYYYGNLEKGNEND